MVTKTVEPLDAIFRKRLQSNSALCESKPDVGSSKNTSGGSVTSSTPIKEKNIISNLMRDTYRKRNYYL